MQRKRIYIGLMSALVSALLLPYNTKGQEINDKIDNRSKRINPKKDKIAYRNYIWIEGENAAATNFSKEKTYNFYCSNKYALQLSKEADPVSDKGYYATYVFHVPRTKSYDFWMGCTPPGSKFPDKPGYASPFQWKIDNGIFRTASAENTYIKKYYAAGGFYWVKISTGKLSAGKHTLTIKIKQKRSSGWDYFFYIDAILFIPTYSGDLIPIMKFPDAAPADFKTGRKGISLRKIEYYKKNIARSRDYRNSVFTLLQIYTWLYQYDKAIDLCNEYLGRYPKDIEIRLLLASTLAWSDRLDDALKEYKNIISIDTNNITARKLLAVLAGWNNRYDEAVRNYREIIKIDPMNIDAYISLATQLMWKGDVNQAIKVFQKAETIAPDNIEVLYALGDNYYWSGKVYKAINQFKKIISLNEKEIQAYKKLATIYMELGRKKRADEIISEADRIRNIYPELSGISLDLKGEREKQLQSTIREYQTILNKNPEDIEARKNLIDTYRWNKMDNKAIEEYNNLLNIKVVQKIDETEEKIKKLQFDTVKLQILQPILNNVFSKMQSLSREYGDAEKNIKTGGKTDEKLTEEKIRSDAAFIEYAVKIIKRFEKELLKFNNTMEFYNRDVESYLAQRNALKWKFDRQRILDQAKASVMSLRGDYRPVKVVGLLEFLYGNRSEAVKAMNIVYNKAPSRAIPLYILTLSGSGQFRNAENLLSIILNKKIIKGRTGKLIKQLKDEITSFKPAQINTLTKKADSKESLIQKNSQLSSEGILRLQELLREHQRKLKKARSLLKMIFEKAFLDLENDNVPIYKELARYYLNKQKMLKALDYYNNILQVQPLNVDINFKLGNLNEFSGYWRSAMANYEICINNQLDNDLARKSHYELQKRYSPSLESNSLYHNEKAVTRISEDISASIPVNDWFYFSAGYRLYKIDERGGESQTGQTYPGLDTGSIISHSAYINTEFRIVPLLTTIYLNGRGNYYKGTIDFEFYDLYDSSPNYYTFNYGIGLKLSPLFKVMSMKLGYRHEDISELTQALRLEQRDEITSNTIEGVLDFSFGELNFPLSDRLFLYDSFKYRMISDTNSRLSSYNELTFRLIRFANEDIYLDMSGIYSYESSEFQEYEVSDSKELPSLPYWAPENLQSYGGGLKWAHAMSNVMKGTFNYKLAFQYTGDSQKNKNFNSGIELFYKKDKLSLFLSYYYSHSIIEPSANNPDPEPYKSHDIKFGIRGKFFKVYSPSGIGGKPIIFVKAAPTLITADGDGKDDFTNISLTAFDERGIKSWQVEIFNSKGKKVKTIGRKGSPPSTIRWDGTDKANNLLPGGEYYLQLSITNSGGEKSSSKKEKIFLSRKRRAVTLEPSYKYFSPNKDGIKDKISLEIRATDKNKIESWQLNIRNSGNRIVRSMSGYEFLPYDIEWDGKNSKGQLLSDGKYRCRLKITYTDKKSIISPFVDISISTSVKARLTTDKNEFTPGKESILIKPDSSNKDLDSWKVNFSALDGRILKVIQGSGKLPDYITWDGKDGRGRISGYNMNIAVSMEIVDAAGNKASSDKKTVWLDFLTKKESGKMIIYLFNQGIIHKGKSARFEKESEKILERLISLIKKQGSYKNLRVISHTSSDGSESMNKELSKERAKSLIKRIKNKIKFSKYIFKGSGESEPYQNNKLDSRYEIELF